MIDPDYKFQTFQEGKQALARLGFKLVDILGTLAIFPDPIPADHPRGLFGAMMPIGYLSGV